MPQLAACCTIAVTLSSTQSQQMYGPNVGDLAGCGTCWRMVQVMLVRVLHWRVIHNSGVFDELLTTIVLLWGVWFVGCR